MVELKKLLPVILCLLVFGTFGNSIAYGDNTSKGMVELALDKTSANVGELIKATLSIKDIQNFSGFDLEIKYDPAILKPVYSDERPYTDCSIPEHGELLQNKEFGPYEIGRNHIKTGKLQISKFYLNLESYEKMGVAETTGSLAIIYFKVLKFAPTKITMNKPYTINESEINIFDWFGNIMSGYSLIQPQEINSLSATPMPSNTPTPTATNTPTPTNTPTNTPTPTKQPEELLHNPSFTQNTSNWYLWTEGTAKASGERDTTTFDSAPAGYRIDFTSKGVAFYEAQFFVYGFKVEAGKTYKFTFKAKSEGGTVQPFAYLMQKSSPWKTYAPGKSFTIGNSWTTQEAYFTSNTTDSSARITIYLGDRAASGSKIYFDSFSLKEVSNIA